MLLWTRKSLMWVRGEAGEPLNSHAGIQCARLPVFDVSWAFGATFSFSAAESSYCSCALRHPLVTEDNHYAVRSRLSDRQVPLEHRYESQ